MSELKKVEQFLAAQQHMVLAVMLPDGTPWAVPVKIHARKGNVFEWESKLDTVHSRALGAHPGMAITIFQKQENAQTGFYAKGHGELIETRGEFGRYRFMATKCWLNDETFVKREVRL